MLDKLCLRMRKKMWCRKLSFRLIQKKFDSLDKFSKPKNLLSRRVIQPYSFASIVIKEIFSSSAFGRKRKKTKKPRVSVCSRLKPSFTSMKRCFYSSPSPFSFLFFLLRIYSSHTHLSSKCSACKHLKLHRRSAKFGRKECASARARERERKISLQRR